MATSSPWTVVLEEGFWDDLVVFKVNGREIYRRQISTSPLVGMADSFQLPTPVEPAKLEVSLPAKDVASELTLPTSAGGQLVVSFAGNALSWEIPDEPRGYA